MSQNKEQKNNGELYYVLGTHTISYHQGDSTDTVKFVRCTNIFGQENTFKIYTINHKGVSWDSSTPQLINDMAFVERGDEIIVRECRVIRNLTQERLKAKLLAEHAKLVR